MRRIGWRLRRELRVRAGVVRARAELLEKREPPYLSPDTFPHPLAAVALGTRARDVVHAARRWGEKNTRSAAQAMRSTPEPRGG